MMVVFMDGEYLEENVRVSRMRNGWGYIQGCA